MLKWSKGEKLRETGSHKPPPDVTTVNPSSRQAGSSPTARKLAAERLLYREYQNEQPENIKIRKPSKTAPAICKKLIVIPFDGTMPPSISHSVLSATTGHIVSIQDPASTQISHQNNNAIGQTANFHHRKCPMKPANNKEETFIVLE